MIDRYLLIYTLRIKLTRRHYFDEIERYFKNTGQELLMEEISEVIHSQHDRDWVIPYCYDISVEDLEYEVDRISEIINVRAQFLLIGRIVVARQ